MEMEKFINDYSIKQYGKDYNVKLDLTYRYKIKNDSVWRKWISRLKKHLNYFGVIINK